SAGPAEALRHYEVALRLARDPGSAGRPAPGVNPAELAARAGDCALAAGRADRAESILRAALRNEPAPPERAQLLYGLATTGLLTDRPDVAIAATAEALELIPAEPTVIRARLLATRVLALVAPGDRNEEAEQLLDEAADLARRFERPDALVAVRAAQAWLAPPEADPVAVRAPLREAAAAARARNDPAELRALYNLGGLALE